MARSFRRTRTRIRRSRSWHSPGGRPIAFSISCAGRSCEMSEPIRIDRRTTLKWVLAASATMPLLKQRAFGMEAADAAAPAAHGYGTDPDLTKTYRPGDVWPLTFTRAQRRTAAALCDVI